jgi:alanine racemase
VERISLGRLASIVGGEMVGSPVDEAVVGGVAIHSERLPAESVFFALRGASDGHRYVGRALAHGAVAAVVAEDYDAGVAPAGPLVRVADPLAALQALAGWWRTRLSARVVAVVGGNGKTVTKDALVHALTVGGAGHVHASPGSYNSQLGVALSVLACPADADVAVLEAAATQPGEMAGLRRIVRPDAVVLTNIGTRHAHNFADRATHARELLAMAADLPADGWVLVGEPDEEVVAWARAASGVDVLVAGASEGLPVLSAPRHVHQGLLVTASFAGGPERDLMVPTPSREVLGDVGLAMSAATLLGVEPRRVLAAFTDYTPTATRMEMWQRADGAMVLGEVATTDPLALASALRAARSLRGAAGRVLVVLGDPRHDEATLAELARVGEILRAEQAAVVCGFRVRAHEEIARGFEAAGGAPVRLFADADELRAFVVAELGSEDVALVHAPRESVLSGAWRRLVEDTVLTRLFVDLAAVRSNVAAFRQLVGAHTKLMGVVKADGYGTSSVSVAHCLREAGADWLGVATTEEGIALRRAGIPLPVLVFLGLPDEIDKMLRHGLVPLVYSTDMADAVLAVAARRGRSVEVHLEVDSGMHRTGLHPDLAIETLRRLRGTGVAVTGLMTHLGCSDAPEDDDVTREQLDRFQKVWTTAGELGYRGVLRHAAATAGTIRFPEARLDMVRIGLGLYGIHPAPSTVELASLTPAIGLVSRIVEIHDMEPGDWAGYGGRYRAVGSRRRIGLIPAGYYDAVPRSFGNVGFVLVNGRECRIAGTVSMDSMAIDITGHPDAQVGSDVLVFGHHAGFSLPVELAAQAMGTVPHELLTGVGRRVQRVFTQH